MSSRIFQKTSLLTSILMTSLVLLGCNPKLDVVSVDDEMIAAVNMRGGIQALGTHRLYDVVGIYPVRTFKGTVGLNPGECLDLTDLTIHNYSIRQLVEILPSLGANAEVQKSIEKQEKSLKTLPSQ